jgi:CHAT domain-containing protein/tetratricopeptide (TPR) repeat protein
MARQNHDQDTVRRYLLKKLSDAEQQDVARRILTDHEFSTELEIGEDELIDEYVTHELSRADRARFQQDFLTTPERLSKLKSAQTLKRYFDRVTPAPNPKDGRFPFLPKWPALSFVQGPDSVAFFSSRAVMAMTLLLVAVAGVIIWRVVVYKSDLQTGLMALNDAYRQERPIEARVSTLDYAPFGSTRSGNEQVPVNTFELDRAKRFLSDAEKRRADAASAHALGKLHLMQKEFEKAIEYLDRAAKTDSKNPQIYADLGAAYLEKGRSELDANKSKEPNEQSGKGLVDLGRSLEYLKQSLELDPNLLEALFNRGLVHEQQGLYGEAENDWRAYIDKDSTSQWAVDARTKLKSLEGRKNRGSQDTKSETFMHALLTFDNTTAWEIYQRNYTKYGNRLTDILVDQFLASEPGPQSDENLVALRDVGELETRNAEDSFTADLARIYASATPQTKTLLVEARRQFKEGYKVFEESNFRKAAELFTSAQKTFDQVGDQPESLAAAILIAHVAALEADSEGQEVIAKVVSDCQARRYKWLLGQALIKRAHIQSNLNNYSDAIEDSRQALQIFQDLKDLYNMFVSSSQLANLHYLINNHDTSLSFLKRAMTIAEVQDVPPTQLWSIYIVASANLSALKLNRAALDYQDEALQLALRLKTPFYISRSYQNIGLTYGALRQFDLAFESVRRAYEQGKSRETERDGKNMMASAARGLGDLYRASGDETSALAAYDESSRFYGEIKFDHYSYPAHKGKFLSYLAQNNDALAEQELEIILNLFEKYREKIVEDRQTSYFFDKEQDICDLAIDFTYFRLNDQHRAFDRSEICRARNLHRLIKHGAKVTPGASGLDLRSSQPFESGNASPLTGAEIQQQVPKQVQIVQYAVLEKRLLVWCITRSEIFTRFIEVDSSTLKDLVTTALNQIRQRDDKGSADSLKRLYDLLIAPVSSRLDSTKVLCFIPDESLHSLPFGALMSTTSGHYLAQDYQLMTSPSSTILIESSHRAQERSSVQEERLLAVGNPTFDRSSNPSLPNLASAEGEVNEIARGYPPHARVLVGAQATRTSVMNELPRAQVAHFAAHYQIDHQSPLSSKVLLSPEPGDRAHAQSSALVSADIYQMDLTGTRLVVLSACQTGVEQELRGEGAIGFARSFLVAGVPVVVASLWPVDSEATSELMISFHHYRRVKHLPTTEALTRAQQEMMTHEKYSHPYYWAGFTAIGGYSEF